MEERLERNRGNVTEDNMIERVIGRGGQDKGSAREKSDGVVCTGGDYCGGRRSEREKEQNEGGQERFWRWGEWVGS